MNLKSRLLSLERVRTMKHPEPFRVRCDVFAGRRISRPPVARERSTGMDISWNSCTWMEAAMV
jgi:hypothetical protein